MEISSPIRSARARNPDLGGITISTATLYTDTRVPTIQIETAELKDLQILLRQEVGDLVGSLKIDLDIQIQITE